MLTKQNKSGLQPFSGHSKEEEVGQAATGIGGMSCSGKRHLHLAAVDVHTWLPKPSKHDSLEKYWIQHSFYVYMQCHIL